MNLHRKSIVSPTSVRENGNVSFESRHFNLGEDDDNTDI